MRLMSLLGAAICVEAGDSERTLNGQRQATPTTVAGTLDLANLTIACAGSIADAVTGTVMIQGDIRLQRERDVVEHHSGDEKVEPLRAMVAGDRRNISLIHATVEEIAVINSVALPQTGDVVTETHV